MAFSVRLNLVGDHGKLITGTKQLAARFVPAAERAMFFTAENLRDRIRKNIQTKHVGGPPLARLTVALKRMRGAKHPSYPWLETGRLVNSLRVTKIRPLMYRVGVGLGQGTRGHSLHKIASMLEFGAVFSYSISPKQMGFFQKLSRGEVHKGGVSRSGREAPKVGGNAVTVRIPPRPVFGPTTAAFLKSGQARRVYLRSLLRELGPDARRLLGKVVGAGP